MASKPYKKRLLKELKAITKATTPFRSRRPAPPDEAMRRAPPRTLPRPLCPTTSSSGTTASTASPTAPTPEGTTTASWSSPRRASAPAPAQTRRRDRPPARYPFKPPSILMITPNGGRARPGCRPSIGSRLTPPRRRALPVQHAAVPLHLRLSPRYLEPELECGNNPHRCARQRTSLRLGCTPTAPAPQACSRSCSKTPIPWVRHLFPHHRRLGRQPPPRARSKGPSPRLHRKSSNWCGCRFEPRLSPGLTLTQARASGQHNLQNKRFRELFPEVVTRIQAGDEAATSAVEKGDGAATPAVPSAPASATAPAYGNESLGNLVLIVIVCAFMWVRSGDAPPPSLPTPLRRRQVLCVGGAG